MRIVEPGRHRDGVVRMEDIGSRRIIDDDRFGHLPSKLREILEEEIDSVTGLCNVRDLIDCPVADR